MNLSPVVRIERVKIDAKQSGSDTSSRTPTLTRSLRSSQKTPDIPKHFYSSSTYQLPETFDSDEEIPDPDSIVEEESIEEEEPKKPEPSDDEPRGRLFGGLKKIDFDPKVDPPPGSCLQCHKEGHSYVKCPNPKRQNCFNCGRWNTLVTICPRCSDAYKRAMTEGKLGKAKYANPKPEEGKASEAKDEEKETKVIKFDKISDSKEKEKETNNSAPSEPSETKEEEKDTKVLTPSIPSEIKIDDEKTQVNEGTKEERQESKDDKQEVQEVKEEKKTKPGIIRLTRLSRQQKIDEPVSEPAKPVVIRLTRLNRQQKVEEPEPEVKILEHVNEKAKTSEPEIQILEKVEVKATIPEAEIQILEKVEVKAAKTPEAEIKVDETIKVTELEIEKDEGTKTTELEMQKIKTPEPEKMEISKPEIEKAKSPEPEVIELDLEEHFEPMEEFAEDSETKKMVEKSTKDPESTKEKINEPKKIDLPGLGEGQDLGVDKSRVPKGRFFDPKATIPFDPKMDPPPGTCYQCHKPGHLFEECTDERKVCVNCGRWNVNIRQCPRCSRFYRSVPKPQLDKNASKATKKFADTLKINPQNTGFIYAVKAAFRRRLRSQLFPRLLLSINYVKRIDALGRECLKCHRSGHDWYKCSSNQNRPWCISCGRWDVGVEDCPRCQEAFSDFWSKESHTWDIKQNYNLPGEKQSEKDSSNSEKKSHKNCSECIEQFKCHEAGHWRDNVKNLTKMFKCTGCDWMGILVIDCPRCEESKGKSSKRRSRNTSKEREETQINKDVSKSENRSRNKSKEPDVIQDSKDATKPENRSSNKSKEREETQAVKDTAKSENRNRNKSKERDEPQVAKDGSISENRSKNKAKEREEPYIIKEGTMFGNLKIIEFDPKIDPPERGCFACHKKGHIYTRCPTKKRDGWCINCGRWNVNVSECPRCSEGNKLYLRDRAKEYYGKEGSNPKKRNVELEKKFKRFYLVGTSFSGLEFVEFDPKLDSPMGACFQCHNKGHGWAKCPEGKSSNEKRVWCSNCGRWDVYVTECPRCKEAYKRHFKVTDEDIARKNKDRAREQERERERIRDKEKEKEKNKEREKEREKERDRGKRDNRKRKAEDEGQSQPPPKKIPEFSFKLEGTAFGGLKSIPFDLMLDAPSKACFQCHKLGHSWSKCPNPKRSIWCFNCGRWEVQAENCPRCSEAHKIYVKEQEERRGRLDRNRDRGRDRDREREKEKERERGRERERENDKTYSIPKLVTYPHLDKEYSSAGHNKKMDAETAKKPYYMTVNPREETGQHCTSRNTEKIDAMIFDDQAVNISSMTSEEFFRPSQDIREQSSAEFFRSLRNRGAEGMDDPWEMDSGSKRPWQPFTSAMEETRKEQQINTGRPDPWGNQGGQMTMEPREWENSAWRNQGGQQNRQENRDWFNQENQENRQPDRDWFDRGDHQNMREDRDWFDRGGQQNRQEDKDRIDRGSQQNRKENRDWPDREGHQNRRDDGGWPNQGGQQNKRNDRDWSDRGSDQRRQEGRDWSVREDQQRREEDRNRNDRGGQQRRQDERNLNDRGGQQKRQDERDWADREGQPRRHADDPEYRSGPQKRQTEPGQKTDWAPFGGPPPDPWQQVQRMDIDSDQFINQGPEQGKFGNQRPLQEQFNNPELPQNRFINQELPQGQFVNQGPPQNRFDNQRPPQGLFDNQGPGQSVNKKPLPGLFDNPILLPNQFGNPGPLQGQFNEQEPIKNQFDNQGLRQNQFDNQVLRPNKFANEDFPSLAMNINDQSKRSGRNKPKDTEKDAPRKAPNQLAFLNSIGSILGRLTEETNPQPIPDKQQTWSNDYHVPPNQTHPNVDQMNKKSATEGRKAARSARGSRWGPPTEDVAQPTPASKEKPNVQTFETDAYRLAQQQQQLRQPDKAYGQQINPYQSTQMGLDRSGYGQTQIQGPVDSYQNQGQGQSKVYRSQQMQGPDNPQQNQMQRPDRSAFGQPQAQNNSYQASSVRTNQVPTGSGQSYGPGPIQEQPDPYRSNQMRGMEKESQRPKQMRQVDSQHSNQMQVPQVDPYQSSKAGYGQTESKHFNQMQVADKSGYGQNQGMQKSAYGQVDDYNSSKLGHKQAESYGFKQMQEVENSGYGQSNFVRSYEVQAEDRSKFPQAESQRPSRMHAMDKSSYGQADSYRTNQTQVTDEPGYGQPDPYRSKQMQTADKPGYGQADSYRANQMQSRDKSNYGQVDPYRSNQIQAVDKSSYNKADSYRSCQMQATDKSGYNQPDSYRSTQMQATDKSSYNQADSHRSQQVPAVDKSSYNQTDSYRSNQMQPTDKSIYNQADSYRSNQTADKSSYVQVAPYRSNQNQPTAEKRADNYSYEQLESYHINRPHGDQTKNVTDAYSARQSQAQVDSYQRQRQPNTYPSQNPNVDPNPNYYQPNTRSTDEPNNQAVAGSNYSGYNQAGQTREGSNWESYKTSSFQTSQKQSNDRVVNNPNSSCPESQKPNPKQQRPVQAPVPTSNPSTSQSSSSLTAEQMKKLAALTPSSQAFMSTLFLKKIAGFDEILNLFSAMAGEAQESFITQLKQAGY